MEYNLSKTKTILLLPADDFAYVLVFAGYNGNLNV